MIAAVYPVLTVSIVYYDTEMAVFERTLANLRHAIAQLNGPVHVVVVDNGDRLESERVNAPFRGPSVPDASAPRLLNGHRNVGFGGGHNLALAQTPPSDYHLILNPDVYLDPVCLTRALATLAARPEAVALTPRAENGDGTPLHLCKRYPDPFTLILRAAPPWLARPFRHRLARYEQRYDHSLSRVSDDVELASGCCLLCRRDALDALGGFDPRYFLYFEDFDLSLRLRRRGRILFDPTARIVHLGGGVARKRLRHWRLFAVSAVKFFRRHGVRDGRPTPASAKDLHIQPRL